MIIDISHWQIPSNMDYKKLAEQVDLAIIRTQYGSRTIDKHYKTHHREFKKQGVATNAYAWVRGINENDMRIEARDFYKRTKEFEPIVWWLDVEENSMSDMRAGVKAYVDELRKLGAKKVGCYIAHHLYSSLNLDLKDFDVIWIPHYGVNNGKANSKPHYPCDLHQFTDKGKLEGYNGFLDLNRIISGKPLGYFTGMQEGWQFDSGVWTYVTSDGGLYRGWLLHKDKWYYLDPRSGEMVTGFHKVNGKWYGFNQSGAMLSDTALDITDSGEILV